MSRAVAATPMRKPFMTALGRVRRPAPPEAPSPPGAAASPGAPSPPSARPTASIVSPTATMCAWYQVVVFCAAYQKAVPKAQTTVVPARTTIETPSRPIIHQHSATSTAAKIVKINWSSAWRPKAATNGITTRAGSGGNGIRPRSLPATRPMGRTSWKR